MSNTITINASSIYSSDSNQYTTNQNANSTFANFTDSLQQSFQQSSVPLYTQNLIDSLNSFCQGIIQVSTAQANRIQELEEQRKDIYNPSKNTSPNSSSSNTAVNTPSENINLDAEFEKCLQKPSYT